MRGPSGASSKSGVAREPRITFRTLRKRRQNSASEASRITTKHCPFHPGCVGHIQSALNVACGAAPGSVRIDLWRNLAHRRFRRRRVRRLALVRSPAGGRPHGGRRSIIFSPAPPQPRASAGPAAASVRRAGHHRSPSRSTGAVDRGGQHGLARQPQGLSGASDRDAGRRARSARATCWNWRAPRARASC